MAENQKVVKPKITSKNKIADKVKLSKNTDNLSMRFDDFHLSPICLRGKFNNHFKDNEHFSNVIANFLGIILPKISYVASASCSIILFSPPVSPIHPCI